GSERVCHAGWARFQEIEQIGGAWAALERGVIQNKVAGVRVEREAAVARRKDAITGTSDFPDLAEAPASVLHVAQVAPPPPAAFAFEPLPSIRLAAPLEQPRHPS